MNLWPAQKGMTLIEVVVATVIFSMIMLGVTTALNSFARTYDRLQVMSGETNRVREVDRFLRQALADASPESGHFVAENGAVEWVAPLDRVGSAGGLQHLKLYWSDGELVLAFAPFDSNNNGEVVDPSWGEYVPAFTLLNNVEDFSISFRSAPEDDWSNSLGDQSETPPLPLAVRLEFQVQGHRWPPLIVNFTRFRGGES